MLTIRLQRTGRKGHAQFRVVVQDSRTAPTSGKVIAQLGSYNPHTKETNLKKDKIAEFLKNGAQPSERAVRLFTAEKISLPKWVVQPTKQSASIKNADKLRRNQPAQPVEEAPTEEVSEAAPAAEEAPAEPETATPSEETPAA